MELGSLVDRVATVLQEVAADGRPYRPAETSGDLLVAADERAGTTVRLNLMEPPVRGRARPG